MREGSSLQEGGPSQERISSAGSSSNAKPLSQARPSHTSLPQQILVSNENIFSHLVWGVAEPAPHLTARDSSAPSQLAELRAILERAVGFCLRRLDRLVPLDHPCRSDVALTSLFRLVSILKSNAQAGKLPLWHPQWEYDTPESLALIWGPVKDIVDVKVMMRLGANLPALVLGHESAMPTDAHEEMMNDMFTNSARIARYTTRLARTVKQISHRYPQMHILEIKCRIESVRRQILDEIGPKFASYTVTTPQKLNETYPLLDGFSKTSIEPSDGSQGLVHQGMRGKLYDLIVAPMSLQTSTTVSSTLQRARQLLKPGGYLVILEMLPSIDSFHDVFLGALTHWWCGAEGQWPGLSSSEWDLWLQKTGFSGIGSISSKEDDAMPFAVMVSQAVDSSIACCQDPLANSIPRPTYGAQISELVIIGGDNGMAPTFASQLSALFGGIFDKTRNFRILQDFLYIDVLPNTVVICLADLETPSFERLDAPKWAALKKLLTVSGILIWVTMGRLSRNPQSNMVLGLLRGAACASPALNYLLLDFEDPASVYDRTIAEKALQHINSSARVTRGDNVLLTIEHEIVIDIEQRSWVPRLMMNKPTNNRFNAEHLNIARSPSRSIRISNSGSGWSFGLERMESGQDSDTIPLRVIYSLLYPVKMAQTGSLFVVMGKEIPSGDVYLAATSKNSSIVHARRDFRLPLKIAPGSEKNHLWLVAHFLIVLAIFRGLSEGKKPSAHGLNTEFSIILPEETRLLEIGFTVAFTNPFHPEGLKPSEVSLHPKTAQDNIMHISEQSLSALFDMAFLPHHVSNGELFAAVRPVRCKKYDVASLVGQPPRDPKPSQACDITWSLLKAMIWAHKTHVDGIRGTSMDMPSFNIDSLPECSNQERTLALFDWAEASKVATDINYGEPVNSVTFNANKTYWLVGLSDPIALLLSRWMASRGARHLVVTSLNTNLGSAWSEDLALKDVCIKAASCDITCNGQLERLYEGICSNMPEVAGIVQGAMACQDASLEDIPFRDLTIDQLFTGAKPSISGSINLDQLFQENTLDFFVFLSTASSVVGIPSQASHAVGDTFMSSVAERRRRTGLAASIIHCGPLLGDHGACEELDGAVIGDATMQQAGFVGTSEEAFRELFSQAILAGRPGSNASIELVSGLTPIHRQANIKPVWEAQALMSHLVVGENETGTG